MKIAIDLRRMQLLNNVKGHGLPSQVYFVLYVLLTQVNPAFTSQNSIIHKWEKPGLYGLESWQTSIKYLVFL